MINEGVKHVRTAEEKSSYRRRVLRRNVIGTLMAMPPFLGFVLFTLIPMGFSLWISFMDLRGAMLENATPIGFANYIAIFKDRLVLKALGNTGFYCLSVPINLAACLFLANLLYAHEVVGEKWLRIVFFLPQVCTGVAVTLMWSYVYSDIGMINIMCDNMGISAFKAYSDKDHFRIALISISLWQNGTNIILMQSALANVNKSLQEAARIDGATEMQVFWKITFPGVTPTLFYILIMNFVTASQEMALMSVFLSDPKKGDYMGLTMSWYIYYTSSGGMGNAAGYGYGFASALSWVYSIFLIIITRVGFKISEKWVSYD